VPKILIALTSCVRDAQNGVAQAQRDTWLQDVAKYPDVTYKFFLGDGTPTGEDDAPLRAMAKGAHDDNRGINYEEKCKTGDAKPQEYTPKNDEVFLSVPDDYFHLVFKVRKMHQWALDNGFEYVYKADTDTYVDLERLMASGFEQHDFTGWQSSPQHPVVAGGGGYWLSKRSLQVSAASPITVWAEDHWISNTLCHRGIKLFGDTRYSDNLVTRRNNLISTHVGFKAGYTPSMMYEAHSKQKEQAPKVLIAISGWVKGATNGDHDAIRETWVEDLQYHTNLSYRFFIGDGTPVTAADETRLESAFQHATRGHKHKAITTKVQDPFTYQPKSDEVIVPCPDGYLYLGHKSWHAHKWALDHGYDYVFHAFPDTFIDVDKLMKSGFEGHDYIGVGLGGHEREFASGGCGYWISRKAIEVHLKEPVDDWAEDRYVGRALGRNGIKLHFDPRYGDGRRQPRSNNEFITEHLCDTPKVYDNTWMRDAYRNSKLSGEVVQKEVAPKYPNARKGQKQQMLPGSRRPIRGNSCVVDWFDTHPRTTTK
jgi:hypothetical protein